MVCQTSASLFGLWIFNGGPYTTQQPRLLEIPRALSQDTAQIQQSQPPQSTATAIMKSWNGWHNNRTLSA